MINVVTLVGRMTQHPDLRYTNSGTAVCNFTLAVERDMKNQNGEKETDFIKCVSFKKQAEIVAQYRGKGSLNAVTGRLQIRSYEKNGQRQYIAEVVTNNVQFLDRGEASSHGVQSNRPTNSQPTSQFDEDPFAESTEIDDSELPF